MINTDTKDHNNIKMNTDISSIIYYLNTENMEDKLKENMHLIGEYFTENGVEDFNYAHDNKQEEYMKLGRNMGKTIDVKQCRIIVDKEFRNISKLSDEISIFYKQSEIFPRYLGVYTTDTEFVWDDKLGTDEETAKALYTYSRSNYNKMVMMYGKPYQEVSRYSIMNFTSKKEGASQGQYLSKEEAKKKLKLEESTDEPQIITEDEIEQESNEKIKEDIKQRLSFLNDYYEINFEPTNEQMKEMIEFANNTENFGNDELLNFIEQKGWGKRSSSTNQNNSDNSLEQSNSSNMTISSSESVTSSSESKTSSSESATSYSSDNSYVSKGNKNDYQEEIITENEELSSEVAIDVKVDDNYPGRISFVGKEIKVMLNDQTDRSVNFNGTAYRATFPNVTIPKATVKVYIDDTLIKTQDVNIEIKEKRNYIDIDIK